MAYFPPDPGSGRRPRRLRTDYDEYGVSLSPAPPPVGARVSSAEEQSRYETDRFFERATGGRPEDSGLLGSSLPTPRVPGNTGLPRAQAPPMPLPGQAEQIRQLRSDVRQWSPTERSHLERAASFQPRQPTNPASRINPTRWEQEMGARADVARSTLTGIQQQEYDLAEQLRQKDEDRVRSQKESQALSAHGVNPWENKGFFEDDQGRLRPQTRDAGFQYYTRKDDGSVAALFYDPATGRSSEVDPLKAGVFEVDEQGNKIVRVAGEGRTPTIIEKNLALQDQETQAAAQAEAARQTKLVDAEGKLLALDRADTTDQLAAAQGAQSAAHHEETDALSAYGVKPGKAAGFYRHADGRLRPLVRPDGFQRHERLPDGSVVAVYFDAATGKYDERKPSDTDPVEAQSMAPNKNAPDQRIVRIPGETDGGAQVSTPGQWTPPAEEVKQPSWFTKAWNSVFKKGEVAQPQVAAPAPTTPVAPTPAVQTRQQAAAATLLADNEAKKAQADHNEVQRAATAPISGNPLAGMRPSPTPQDLARSQKTLDEAKARHQAAKDAERAALRREIESTKAAIELGAKGITLAQAKKHPRYASDPAKASELDPIEAAKAQVGVGGSAWNNNPPPQPNDAPTNREKATVATVSTGQERANTQGGSSNFVQGSGTPSQGVIQGSDPSALMASGVAAIGVEQAQEHAREAAFKPVREAIAGLIKATAEGTALPDRSVIGALANAAQGIGLLPPAVRAQAEESARQLIDTYAVGAATALKTSILAERVKAYDKFAAEAMNPSEADVKAGLKEPPLLAANRWKQLAAEARAQQATVEQTVRGDIFKAVGPVYSSGYGIPVEEQLQTITRWGKESGASEERLADMRRDAMIGAQGEVIAKARQKAIALTGGDATGSTALWMVKSALDRVAMGPTQARAILESKATPAERRAINDLASDITTGTEDIAKRAGAYMPGRWEQFARDEAAFEARPRPDAGKGAYDLRFPSRPGETFKVQLDDWTNYEGLAKVVYEQHLDKLGAQAPAVGPLGVALTAGVAGLLNTDAGMRMFRDGGVKPVASAFRGLVYLGGVGAEALRFAVTGKSDAANFAENAGSLAQTMNAAIDEALPVSAVRDLKATFSTTEQYRQALLQGIGQLPATIGVGVATGGAGLFSFNAAQMGTEAFDDAIAHGADENTAFQAMLMSLPAAGLETVADKLVLINPLRAKIPKGFVDKLKHIGTEAVSGAATEGGTEFGQQLWGNMAARAYDENRDAFKGATMATAVGAIVGGFAKAGITGFAQYGQAAAAKRLQKVNTAKAAVDPPASSPEAAAATRPAYTPTDAGGMSQLQAMEAADNLDHEAVFVTRQVFGGEESLAIVADGMGLDPDRRADVGFDAATPSDGLALWQGLAASSTEPISPQTAAALVARGVLLPSQHAALAQIARGATAVGAGVDAWIAGDNTNPLVGVLQSAGVIGPDGLFNPAAVALLPPLVRKRLDDLANESPERFGEANPAALRPTVSAGRAAFNWMTAEVDASLDTDRMVETVAAAVQGAAAPPPVIASSPEPSSAPEVMGISSLAEAPPGPAPGREAEAGGEPVAPNTNLAPTSQAGLMAQKWQPNNVVFTALSFPDYRPLGILQVPHDGTEAGMSAALERAREQAARQWGEVSYSGSFAGATDEGGAVRWWLGPKGKPVEVDTPEGRYQMGDTNALRDDKLARILKAKKDGDIDTANKIAAAEIAKLEAAVEKSRKAAEENKAKTAAAKKHFKKGGTARELDDRLGTDKAAQRDYLRMYDPESSTSWIQKQEEEIAQWRSLMTKSAVTPPLTDNDWLRSEEESGRAVEVDSGLWQITNEQGHQVGYVSDNGAQTAGQDPDGWQMLRYWTNGPVADDALIGTAPTLREAIEGLRQGQREKVPPIVQDHEYLRGLEAGSGVDYQGVKTTVARTGTLNGERMVQLVGVDDRSMEAWVPARTLGKNKPNTPQGGASEIENATPTAGVGIETQTPEQIYDASLEDFRVASRAFDKIRRAYRAEEIGDDEFLAGKAAFDEAMRVSDIAETAFIEAKNNPPPTPPPTPEPSLPGFNEPPSPLPPTTPEAEAAPVEGDNKPEATNEAGEAITKTPSKRLTQWRKVRDRIIKKPAKMRSSMERATLKKARGIIEEEGGEAQRTFRAKSGGTMIPEHPLGAQDILNAIEENGGILLRAAEHRRGGDDDDIANVAAQLPMRYRSIFKKGGQPADRMAVHLRDAGWMADDDVKLLAPAILAAYEGRIRARAQVAEQEKAQNKEMGQAQHFADSALKPSEGAKPVQAGDLHVGDTVTVDDAPLVVTEYDPDTGQVTLEDGATFGIQRVDGDQMLFVEDYESRESSSVAAWEAEMAAEEEPALTLDTQTPESVRADREAQEKSKATKAQADEIERRRTAKLSGDSSSVGQGALFEEDADLFSGPSAQRATPPTNPTRTDKNIAYWRKEHAKAKAVGDNTRVKLAEEKLRGLETTAEPEELSREAPADARATEAFERAQTGDESAFADMDAEFRERFPFPESEDELAKATAYTPEGFERIFETSFKAKDFDSILDAVKESDRGVWVPLLKKFFREQASDPVAAAKAEWMRHIFAGTRPPNAKARTAPSPSRATPPPRSTSTPPKPKSAPSSPPPPPRKTGPPPPPAPPPPPKRIPVNPITGVTAKSPFKIIDDFSRAIGKSLRVRKLKKSQAGAYRPGSTMTANRFASDLDTAAHELAGHWTDDKYGIGKPWMAAGVTSPYDAELATFWAHGTPSSSLKIRRAEGIAEYVRAYVMDPAAAKAQAPKFSAYFEKTIPQKAMEDLNQFSNDVRAWAGEKPLRRAALNIRLDPPTIRERLRKAILGDNREFSKSGVDKFRSWFDDSYHYAVKGWRAALAMQGKDISTIKPSDNFDLMLRLLSSHDARLSDQLDNGLIPLKPTQVTDATTGKMAVDRQTDPVTKQAMNLGWLLEPFDNSGRKAQEQDMREASALMVAQRTLEKADIIDKEAQALIAALDPKDPGTPKQRQKILSQAEAKKRTLSGLGAGMMTDVEAARQALADLGADPLRAKRLMEAARRYRLWADTNMEYLVDAGRLSREQADKIKSENMQYVDMHRLSEEFDVNSMAQRGSKGLTAKDVVKRFKGSALEIDNVYKNLLSQTDTIQKEALRNRTMQTFTKSLEATRKLYEGGPVELDRIGSIATAEDRNTVSVWNNGKVEYWKLDTDIYEAVKGLGDMGTHAFLAIASAPVTLARYLITHSPAFMIRNPIRDTVHRSVVSEVGSKPWDILKGYTQEDKSRLEAFGGGQFGNYAKDRLTWNRELKRGMAELRKDPRNIFLSPLELKHAWEKLASSTETVGRVAEFRRAWEKGVHELGYDPDEAALYAASEARGLMDYAKAGSVMRVLNRLIPFSNAHVRGLAKTARTGMRDPAGFAIRWSIYALLPVLAVRAWNSGDDEEEYLQLPAWQRDFFWNFKVGSMWVRIPKPHELGVIAGGIERAIDAATSTENAFEGYGNSLKSALLPIGGLAEASGPLKTLNEIKYNRDSFRDRYIVPPYERDLLLKFRKGTEHASGIGKIIGGALNSDPRYVDHVLQSYGGLGQSLTDFTSSGMRASQSALKATGLTTMPPSTQSRDYAWVTKWAKDNGKTSSSAIKDLADMIDPVFNAPNAEAADKAAKKLREAATELRKKIEAGVIKGGEVKSAKASSAKFIPQAPAWRPQAPAPYTPPRVPAIR